MSANSVTRTRRKLEGRCRDCERKSKPGRIMCPRHLRLHRRAAKANYDPAKRKERYRAKKNGELSDGAKTCSLQ